MNRFAVIGAVAIGMLVGGLGAASAQQLPPGDKDNGLRLARQWCGECHVISPDQTRAPNAAVPTWPSVANRPQTTETYLRAFLQTPHQNMPNIQLTRGETDDLIAYILSLKTAR